MNILFKRIDKDDLELLQKWRMKENVTKYMLTDPIITPESQLQWFNNILKDKSRQDYVIVVDDIRIGYYGVTNINYELKSCEVGFYIGDDAYRGKGLFRIIQNYAENIIFNELNIDTINIQVLENNPIVETYYKLGFKNNSFSNKYICKNGERFKVISLSKQASE